MVSRHLRYIVTTSLILTRFLISEDYLLYWIAYFIMSHDIFHLGFGSGLYVIRVHRLIQVAAIFQCVVIEIEEMEFE